jgi:glyoxylase-like metal-dependent hydrolase (beta-lactamase superfamily II)
MELPENLILAQIELGPLQNFLYFVGDSRTNEIAVVDPAWDVEFLCQEADKAGYKITKILLTHGHPDHVNGLDEILNIYDVPAYISEKEAPFLTPQHKNIQKIKDGDIIKVGDIPFHCILVPGHTPGCIAFKYEDVLITGDAIFIDGCGRCDLPGGDARVMYNSLYKIIMKLPDTTILFTGHNYGPIPYDTLGSQKETNPYLTCSSEQEFLQQRMGITF